MSPNPQVVIIPCCSRKKPGGKSEFQSPGWLRSRLGPASAERPLGARRELAAHFDLQPGPDLGFAESGADARFLPASERYDGNMYRAADFCHTWPRSQGKQVLIVSALYGLLLADDPIREYDVGMHCHGPDGSRLHTWWKRQRLGRIVAECALSFLPTMIQDLLSGNYRKALAPWRAHELAGIRNQYDPGVVGFPADRARGQRLREILQDP